jgi:subtilisin family serine protease
MEEDAIRAPVGGITMASHRGSDVYCYEVNGGRSWATPFVAAVAALGFQVDPDLSPAAVRHLLVDSALKTGAGPMINPAGFIERVQKQRRRKSGR